MLRIADTCTNLPEPLQKILWLALVAVEARALEKWVGTQAEQ